MIRSGIKILVVDDDQNLLDLLDDTLTTIGYEATGSADGFEALEKLKQQKFDLVISDIKMPGMDGLELLREIRESYPDLPVLFITGAGLPETIEKAAPDGFLDKPFRISHIERLIENCLSAVKL